MKNLSERIIEILKETKRVSEADIARALIEYARSGSGKLRDVLVKMNLITEKELLSLVSVELKIPFLNLSKYKIDPEVGKVVPERAQLPSGITFVRCQADTMRPASRSNISTYANI